jgi:hypothetical protein
MKTKITIILLSVLCLNCIELYSQEPCKVLKPEIAEKYVGKCKNGLANGKGVAEGKDKYEGQFKNGLPHGNGKYTFSTGEVYDGKWKEGKREGEGKLFYKKNGVDSVKHGIWGNDVFVKKIVPPPYKILKANSISKYSVRQIGNGNTVLYTFMQNGTINNTLSALSMNSNNGVDYTMGNKTGMRDVLFPYTCRVTYSTMNALRTATYSAEFEIVINQPGDWEIVLDN